MRSAEKSSPIEVEADEVPDELFGSFLVAIVSVSSIDVVKCVINPCIMGE